MKSLSRNALFVGKKLPWSVYDDRGVLMLRKGHSIESQAHLEALVARGLFIKEEVIDAKEKPYASISISPFDLILTVEASLSSILKRPLDSHFESFIRRNCSKLQQACQIDADVALASILLESDATYAVRHSINCAILVDIILSAMSITSNERISIMAACLTMNISMLDEQNILHSQAMPPTPGQRETIRQHPRTGHDWLVAAGIEDAIWLEAVLHHHELLDRTGYPEGVTHEHIGFGSRLIAILDIFCARLYPRADRPAILPGEALREVLQYRGEKYDAEIPAYLIKIMGTYPPGTIVKLSNGETAVVTHRQSMSGMPICKVILDQNGNRLIVLTKRDTRLPQYAIKNVTFLRDNQFKINRNLIWGYYRNR